LLRKVEVKTRKNKEIIVQQGYFHRWAEYAEPVPPGATIGSQQGGQYAEVVAIVELDDGTIKTCSPSSITFLETPLQASIGVDWGKYDAVSCNMYLCKFCRQRVTVEPICDDCKKTGGKNASS